jgi:hypothetical protein
MFSQPLFPIERPRCSRCRNRMVLARVLPIPDNKEKHIF